jgi:hypothetical protein
MTTLLYTARNHEASVLSYDAPQGHSSSLEPEGDTHGSACGTLHEDEGAERVIVFSQRMGSEIADGKEFAKLFGALLE